MLARKYGARVVDETDNAIIFEITSDFGQIEKFIAKVSPLGMPETRAHGQRGYRLRRGGGECEDDGGCGLITVSSSFLLSFALVPSLSTILLRKVGGEAEALVSQVCQLPAIP